MAEIEWGDEEEAPRKKKRVPGWVWWGCGGGCLLMLLIAIAGTLLVGRVVRRAIDPEVAWAEVREVLPYDERPAGWDARGTRVLGFGQYFLHRKDSETMLVVMRFHGAPELEAMLDPASRQNKGVFGLGEIEDPEPGTIALQGREARCLRFRAWIPEAAEEDGPEGTSIRIDLTGNGTVPVLLQITAGEATERIEDDFVQTLLAPFDVWRGR